MAARLNDDRVVVDFQMVQITVLMAYLSRRLLLAKMRSFVDFIMDKFPQPETHSRL